jgi:lipopolysaccharide transport system ATP-binding protein
MFYGIADIGRNSLGLRSHSERLRPYEFWALDEVSFELKRGAKPWVSSA